MDEPKLEYVFTKPDGSWSIKKFDSDAEAAAEAEKQGVHCKACFDGKTIYPKE